jgi:hypothetical protein
VDIIRIALDYIGRNRACDADELPLLQAFVIAKFGCAIAFSTEQDSSAAISTGCHVVSLFYIIEQVLTC